MMQLLSIPTRIFNTAVPSWLILEPVHDLPDLVA